MKIHTSSASYISHHKERLPVKRDFEIGLAALFCSIAQELTEQENGRAAGDTRAAASRIKLVVGRIYARLAATESCRCAVSCTKLSRAVAKKLGRASQAGAVLS